MNDHIQEIESEEFSFKKLVNLIKKSAKRILVYAIIAAVIGGCLAAVILVATKESTEYRASVEFTHKGIVNGLDPNGNVLDANTIKSSVVINAALRSMGYAENEITELSAHLDSIISVSSHVPDNARKLMDKDPTYTYYPSRYTVSLVPNKNTGFTKSKYLIFLNEMTKAYVEYFKTSYNFQIPPLVTAGENAVANAADYFDLIYAYTLEISSIKTTVSAMPDSYASIANQLTSRINMLSNAVVELENIILAKNVQKVGATLSISANIDSRINDNKFKAERYKSEADSLDTSIEKYQQQFDSIITEEGKIIISSADVSVYNNLINDKKAATKQFAAYSGATNELTAKKNILTNNICTPQDRLDVEKKFAALHTLMKNETNAINAEFNKFADKNVFGTGVKVVNPAAQYSHISLTGAVIAFFIVLLIGVASAIVVTNYKMRKFAKLRAAAVVETEQSDKDSE